MTALSGVSLADPRLDAVGIEPAQVDFDRATSPAVPTLTTEYQATTSIG